MRTTSADAVVVGSGFGGAVTAASLIRAGYHVRMLERGPWLRWPRPPAAPRGPRDLAALDGVPVPHRLGIGGNGAVPAALANVGGPSIYFAAVSSRFREADFDQAPEIVVDSAAAWPFRYRDLEPYYSRAETLLGVAGPESGGATEPYRSTPYPQPLGPVSAPTRRLQGAARAAGLAPFRLPLAIHFGGDGRPPCQACAFCDGFPCLIGAKNDVAARVLPPLLGRGLALEPGTAATRLVVRGDRVVGVEARQTGSGERSRHTARVFVLAAGALASPGLILASGLERRNPAGELAGRFLMRHCNAHVFGLFPRRPDPDRSFHKEIGLDDFYFGHPTVAEPAGKLGMIQQMATPWVVLVLLPRRLGRFAAPLVEHMTGFIVMAEDQPQRDNRVVLDGSPEPGQPPRVRIEYGHSPRDLAARAALVRQARSVLRRAGAPFQVVFPINTFSHAVGTLRMGADPQASVVDEHGRFRGLENLYVTDGSTFPTSAGVNPSLTIAAIALRSADHIARSHGSAVPEPAAP